MGITLPDGIKAVDTSDEKNTEIEKAAEFSQKSLAERALEIPKALMDAVTGEGVQIEFPQVPEASGMVGDAPGFLEGIIPNIKTMMTRDDVGKLEVLNNSFKDDPRWGGGFQDKYGNPMLIWNDKPYYINKPGMSRTDFGTFVGEIIKFIPAIK